MTSKVNIDTRLYMGLADTDKEDFKTYFLNCGQVRDQIIKVLEEKLALVQTTSESHYQNNDWAYLQADRNGQVRVLKDLIKLLTPIERKH